VASIASFDEFYVGTRASVLRQLTAMTTDPELAAEVVQEAYARAWQKWSRVADLDNPAAWVRAWRGGWRSVSTVARAWQRGRCLSCVDAPNFHPSPPGKNASTSRRRSAGSLTSIGGCWSCTTMCGMTVSEIAEEMGVAQGTFESWLSWARASLAAALGERYRPDPEVRVSEGEVTS
jgi:RNA polymerase sigma-70 factor (ECF subfamily)